MSGVEVLAAAINDAIRAHPQGWTGLRSVCSRCTEAAGDWVDWSPRHVADAAVATWESTRARPTALEIIAAASDEQLGAAVRDFLGRRDGSAPPTEPVRVVVEVVEGEKGFDEAVVKALRRAVRTSGGLL